MPSDEKFIVEKAKQIFVNQFELLAILIILISITLVNFLIPEKVSFLNFYYLPVLMAGYYLSRYKSILVALASILLVFYSFFLGNPPFLYPNKLYLISSLVVWGCFLMLAAILVGTLAEERKRQIEELKLAYIGVLEILSKYLETGDPATKSHSVRVAEFSVRIAKEMGLPSTEIENIRAAALLHDIGKIEVGVDLINKSVKLTQTEMSLIKEHAQKSAQLLQVTGGVLKQAIPIVANHHKFFSETALGVNIPLGARILAVADAFDAIVSDRPYRAGKHIKQALAELEQGAGTQFDPQVVLAFKKLLTKENLETTIGV